MNRANDILEELKNMESNLGEFPRAMPYFVPKGYFEYFAGSTLEVIKQINEPEAIPAWSKTMPYNIPAGYFETLPDDILANVNSGNAFPGLSQETFFTVPAGYFEALPAQILKAAKASDNAKKETKIIPLKRTFTLTSVKWAAAAILLICVSLGGFFFLQQSPNPERMLASVPSNEIHDYLQHTYRIDVDKVVNNDLSNLQLDNKEIIQYLNETGWDVAE